MQHDDDDIVAVVTIVVVGNWKLQVAGCRLLRSANFMSGCSIYKRVLVIALFASQDSFVIMR